jgi:hypothetical protein
MFPYRQILFALVAPLLLGACLLTPGKFVSTLDIRADRSFTFTYRGEVVALDMAKEMEKGMPSTDSASDEGGNEEASPDASPEASAAADNETKMKAMAEALSKESGYKSARYVGNSTFLIDYEVHGKLDHGFVYPFNVDAEIVFPFIVVELRGADMVRMKAPGYANSDNKKGGMGGMTPPGPESTLDGTFTLTTNAEIISQNNENGSVAAPNGRRIVWKATPLTKDEPMAVLRVAPLK